VRLAEADGELRDSAGVNLELSTFMDLTREGLGKNTWTNGGWLLAKSSSRLKPLRNQEGEGANPGAFLVLA
jgi:hypothetical protein